MPGHSIALALARTASELTGGKAAADLTTSTWGPAPNTPRRHAEPLSRMNSLPDLDSDSCSDSSGSSDDEAGPSTSQQDTSGRNPAGNQAGGSAPTVSSRQHAQESKRDGSEPPMPRQPQLWMGCNCHWQKDDVALKVQQVELAACSSSSAVTSPAELDTMPLPPVPPELSRLMPSGLPAMPAALSHSKLPPEAEASVQRLKAELAHSQAAYRTVLRALHRKTQECESLTGVVQELTSSRAKAAAGRMLLQQRCMALLDDASRLGRVASLARQGQSESCAAAAAADTACMEAEGDAADARREVATLERNNAELAATNRQLVQRVEELECQQPGAVSATQS